MIDLREQTTVLYHRKYQQRISHTRYTSGMRAPGSLIINLEETLR